MAEDAMERARRWLVAHQIPTSGKCFSLAELLIAYADEAVKAERERLTERSERRPSLDGHPPEEVDDAD